MPTALDLAANLTGASITEGQAKTWFTAMRAALAEMGDPMGRPEAIQNLSLAFSVAGNALTCNVKTRAGAAPSATDPVSAAMRNATLATGDFNVRNITGALSLVISSGSTLGHISAMPGRIHWYLIDNAGTLELAASTKYFGESGVVSTTAEGGAGAADSETTMYSTTARSNVSFRCIGHTVDTQTTAGTWASVPSMVELAPINESFVSGELAVGGVGTSVTVAHGLGVRPRTFSMWYRCVTAEHGYAVGDEVHNIAATTVYADATNIGSVRSTTTTSINVVHRSTFAISSMTDANWKIIFRAWR